MGFAGILVPPDDASLAALPALPVGADSNEAAAPEPPNPPPRRDDSSSEEDDGGYQATHNHQAEEDESGAAAEEDAAQEGQSRLLSAKELAEIDSEGCALFLFTSLTPKPSPTQSTLPLPLGLRLRLDAYPQPLRRHGPRRVRPVQCVCAVPWQRRRGAATCARSAALCCPLSMLVLLLRSDSPVLAGHPGCAFASADGAHLQAGRSAFKCRFLAALLRRCALLRAAGRRVIVVGDLNCAPAAIDYPQGASELTHTVHMGIPI